MDQVGQVPKLVRIVEQGLHSSSWLSSATGRYGAEAVGVTPRPRHLQSGSRRSTVTAPSGAAKGEWAVMEDRIIQAFKHIDALRVDEPLLDVLHRRLIAELFGDGDSVAAILEPDFKLVVHSAGNTSTLPADTVAAGVQAQRSAGTLLWTEFDELVVDGQLVAGSGTFCTLKIAGHSLTTMPVAIFLRFTASRMASELAYMGGHSAATAVAPDDMPSIERLRAQLKPESNA
jgi:hypothetical protein